MWRTVTAFVLHRPPLPRTATATAAATAAATLGGGCRFSSIAAVRTPAAVPCRKVCPKSADAWQRSRVWHRCFSSNGTTSSGPSTAGTASSNSVVGSVGHHFKQAPLKAIVFSKKGELFEREVSKADLAQQLLIPTRDLRAVDSSFRNQLPQVLVRETSIILRLEHVRAVIKSNELMLFDPLHPSLDTLFPQLQERLAQPQRYQLPFEFIVLEELLIAVCMSLERQYAALHPVVTDLLDNLTRSITVVGLDRLLPLNNSLRAFHTTVIGVTEALDQLLQSPDELAEMYLTMRSQGNIIKPQDIHLVPELDVEELIDTYVYQLEELGSEVEQLRATVTSTQEYLNTSLDNMRNRILRLDLLLNMGTFSMAVSAAVASVFGMNLVIPLEEHPMGFAIVTTAVTAAGVGLFWSLVRWSRRRNML